MPLPKPNTGESERDFVSRCIRFVKGENPNMDNDQAVAMCFDRWRDSKGKSDVGRGAILARISPEPKLKAKDVGAQDATGGFIGYMAVFNNVDHQREVILPGAFAKSLSEHDLFPLMAVHAAHGGGLRDIVGSFSAKEDDFGLFVDATYEATELAQATRGRTDKGVLRGLSVGYRKLQQKAGMLAGKAVRFLTELALVEGTITFAPANELAVITAAKSLEGEALSLLERLEAGKGAGLSEEDRVSAKLMLGQLQLAAKSMEAYLVEAQQEESTSPLTKGDVETMRRRLALKQARIRGLGL